MAVSKNRSIFSLILSSAVVVTLVGTPMWNKDALVIPKVIILFLVALYLTPIILKKIKTISKNRISNILILILSLLVVQYIAVVLTSSAPLEQQIFGRTGRGIGLITLLSIACMVLASALFIEENKVKTIIKPISQLEFDNKLYEIEQSTQNISNIETIKKLLIGGSLPHLLFYGLSGTGKTSTIMALSKEIYGKNVRLMVMKLDASDDRGINSVRDEIKGFAEKKKINQNIFY